MSNIPGYTFGTSAIATSPVTLAVFEQMKATIPRYGELSSDDREVTGYPCPIAPASAYDALRQPKDSVEDTQDVPVVVRQ